MTPKTPVPKSRVAAAATVAAVVAGLVFFLGGPEHDRAPPAQSPADALADEKAADGSVDADDSDTSPPPAPKCPVADARAALVDRLGGANPFRSDDISAVVSPRGSVFVVAQQDSGILLGHLAPGEDIVWARQFCGAQSPALAVDLQGNALLLREQAFDNVDSGSSYATVLSSLTDEGTERWSRSIEGVESLRHAIALDPRGEIVTAHQTLAAHSTQFIWWDAEGAQTHSSRIEGVRIHSIAVDDAGNIGFGGDFGGRLNIAGQQFNAAASLSEIVAGRLDSSGAIPWAVHLGPTAYANTRVGFDDSGNLTILTTGRDPEDDLLPNLLLVKLDSAGHTLFQRRFRHAVVSLELHVSVRGETFVTGGLGGAVDFGPTVVRGWSASFLATFDTKGNATGATANLPRGCVIARDHRGRLVRFPVAGGAMGRGSEREVCIPWRGLSAAPSAPDAVKERPVEKRKRSVYLRYPLPPLEAGAGGTIETWMDSRITGKNHRDVPCFGWDPLYGIEGIEGWDSPPLEAVVRLVDAQGVVLDELRSGASMITLDPLHLHEDERVIWQMLRKPRVCRSRWQMAYTNLLEVRDGHLHRVSSVDDQGDNPAEIVLMDGMMASWRLPSARSGSGRDLLSAECSLARSRRMGCTPVLTRYAWESGRRVRHERMLEGERWFGEFFPEAREFP